MSRDAQYCFSTILVHLIATITYLVPVLTYIGYLIASAYFRI